MARKIFRYLLLPIFLSIVVASGVTACDGGSKDPTSSAMGSSAQATASTPTMTTTVTVPATSTTSAGAYQPATLKSPAKNVPVPIKPAEADEFSERGLKAFAIYWYKVYNYVVQTGDVKIIEIFTDPSCERCSIVLKDIKDWYESGNWRIGGQLMVTKTQATKLGFHQAANGTYQYMIQYNKVGGGYVTSSQRMDKSYPSTIASGDLFNAIYKNGNWSVIDIGKIG